VKPKYFLFFGLLFYILNSTFSIATVRYVSKTGTSTPPYTSWADAADSIQKCINICSFGDTVYVANGVYQERVVMIPGLSLIGAGMDSCVINSTLVNFPQGTYTIRVTDSCYLSGFQIIPFSNFNQGIGIYIREEPGIYVNAFIVNNTIKQAYTGIGFSGYNATTTNTIIKLNHIFAVTQGIRCELNRPTISQNFIFAKWYGLVSTINSLPTYENNTVVLDDPQAVSGYSGGFHIRSILKNNSFYIYQGEKAIYEIGDSVINNVITGNPEYGMWTQNGGVIINNIIKGAQTGVDHDISTPLPQFQYNDLWGNEINYIGIIPDSTNIYNDPMLMNVDSMDLHLQKYSPLIDAGDPGIIDRDGSRSDIGLYGGPFGENYKYLDLAPRAPMNLTALVDTNYITLNWNRNTEADTSYYRIYRDTVINFTVDSTKLVSSSSDTFFVQINPHNVTKYVYKVTCVDKQGNESEPSEEVVVNITSVSIDDYPMTFSDYRLYQNYPNPFNPSTTISYRLKERGYVKLYLYDIKGELVSVLVNKTQEAGFYHVDFSSSSIQYQESSIQNLASGIYIYQLHIIGENNIPVFTDIKKMIYLK
jgi:hypothetical protein